MQTKEVAECAHVFKLKDLTDIDNELVQKGGCVASEDNVIYIEEKE